MKDRPVLILLGAKTISALPPALTSLIESFDLALRSERKSENTRACYIRAAAKFGLWLVSENVADFALVQKTHIQLYIAWLAETPRPDGSFYADGYVNNQYRALQQFFKWFSAEEDLPYPFATLKPPKVGEKVIPIIEYEVLAKLIRLCEKGRDFESRRDAAMLRLFASSGVRLSELTNLLLENVDLVKCACKVKGKGNKERIVRFDDRTAQAINRYLRMRAGHKYARHPRLWLAVKNRGPMTPNGVRQIIERRGLAAGVDIFPHMFRHTFTHNWLDKEGAEGDLMEQMGWTSPAMIRTTYGRAMRSTRAQRAYDRINVMGDI